MLNRQKGNMYPFVSHTWNAIRGKCPHECDYCYMKGLIKNKELRLEEKEFETNLGNGNFIFVGSSIDMFADSIPRIWIERVLAYCRKFSNKYLFQTKNPKRFHELLRFFPKNSVLGTTLETNRDYKISKAPPPKQRYEEMKKIKGFEKMVSIEPIMDFDFNIMVGMIYYIQPKFVSIGADSKGHNLPEPSKEKLERLIEELKRFTEVKIKKNLKRLL